MTDHIHVFTRREGDVHCCIYKGCKATVPKIERAWSA